MREYLVVLLVAAGVTWLLTPPVRLLALRVGAVTPLRDRDVHDRPVPRLGGVALLAGVAAALLVASRLPVLRSTFTSSDVVAVLVAGAVVCLVGAVDDVADLDALTKLAGQTLAAGVMVLLGAQLLFLVGPGGDGLLLLSSDLGIPLTVLVVLVTVNAINFVDGLDGLAAGVVAISALAFFAYSYDLLATGDLPRADSATLLSAATAGACLGFLPHNHVPARVFMGDSGAMLLGLLLAGTTVSATGRVGATALEGGAAAPFLLPVLLPFAVLALPVGDLVLAVVRRLRSGRSPFSADRGHLHHRFLDIGHSHAQAVWLLWAWAALLAFGGVALSVPSTSSRVLAVAATVAALGLLVAAASVRPRLRHARRRRRDRAGRGGPERGGRPARLSP